STGGSRKRAPRYSGKPRNAGISIETSQPPTKTHETLEDVWDTTITVNAKSVFLDCKYATAQMLRQDVLPSSDRGWIFNMSSIFGLVAGYYVCKLPLLICSLYGPSFSLMSGWKRRTARRKGRCPT
ncbi:hypothetical protein TOPH_06297, partial [Tolypocladium ophioglossoides CBS 100239]